MLTYRRIYCNLSIDVAILAGGNLIINHNVWLAVIVTVAVLSGPAQSQAAAKKYVSGLENAKISLADIPGQEEVVSLELSTPGSGYGDLAEKLRVVLRGRCPIGDAVPINMINGIYYQLIKQSPEIVDKEKNANVVKRAYEVAWVKKNSSMTGYSFDRKAPRCS